MTIIEKVNKKMQDHVYLFNLVGRLEFVNGKDHPYLYDFFVKESNENIYKIKYYLICNRNLAKKFKADNILKTICILVSKYKDRRWILITKTFIQHINDKEKYRKC